MKQFPLQSLLPPLLFGSSFLNFFKSRKKQKYTKFVILLTTPHFSGVLLHRAEMRSPPLCWAFTKRLVMMTATTATRATRIAAPPSNRNLHRGIIIHRTFAQNSSADSDVKNNDSFPEYVPKQPFFTFEVLHESKRSRARA